MNIAYITNFFPPTQTGTAHYTADLAQAMTKLGHRVIVICPSIDGRWLASYTESMLGAVTVYGVPSFKLPKCSWLMGFDDYRVTWDVNISGRVIRILKDNQIDIVHQCGHLLDLTDVAQQAARRLHIPCVCSIHTAIGHPNRALNAVMEVADRLLIESTLKRYDRVIALDREIMRHVSKRYGIISTALPYGVNPSTGFQKWDDGHKHFQITSVGHVTKMRSREDLLRACDELIEEGLDIRVSIIGQVCYQSKKQYKHTDRFRFEGEWYNAGIKHFWETSDLEAHWLTTPGLGTAILEAMACGVPCMTSGYEDLLAGVPLADGHNIVFIPPGDVAEVKLAIRTLYGSPPYRKNVGDNGQAVIENNLTWDKVAPQYERLYQEVIRG